MSKRMARGRFPPSSFLAKGTLGGVIVRLGCLYCWVGATVCRGVGLWSGGPCAASSKFCVGNLTASKFGESPPANFRPAPISRQAFPKQNPSAEIPESIWQKSSRTFGGVCKLSFYLTLSLSGSSAWWTVEPNVMEQDPTRLIMSERKHQLNYAAIMFELSTTMRSESFQRPCERDS